MPFICHYPLGSLVGAQAIGRESDVQSHQAILASVLHPASHRCSTQHGVLSSRVSRTKRRNRCKDSGFLQGFLRRSRLQQYFHAFPLAAHSHLSKYLSATSSIPHWDSTHRGPPRTRFPPRPVCTLAGWPLSSQAHIYCSEVTGAPTHRFSGNILLSKPAYVLRPFTSRMPISTQSSKAPQL